MCLLSHGSLGQRSENGVIGFSICSLKGWYHVSARPSCNLEALGRIHVQVHSSC